MKIIQRIPPHVSRKIIHILDVTGFVSFLILVLLFLPLNLVPQSNLIVTLIKYIAILLLVICMSIICLDELTLKTWTRNLLEKGVLTEKDLPKESSFKKATNILDSICFHSIAISAMVFTAFEAVLQSLGLESIKQPTIIYGLDILILAYYFKIYKKLGILFAIALILIYFTISYFFN
jgi:hypothetical protein